MNSGPFEGSLRVMHGGPFEGSFLRVIHGGSFRGKFFTCNAWWALLREFFYASCKKKWAHLGIDPPSRFLAGCSTGEICIRNQTAVVSI